MKKKVAQVSMYFLLRWTTHMLLKPAVLKGSLATGLGVGAGPGVPGDPAFSVNNSFFSFFLQNIFNIEDQIVFHQ